MTNELNKAIVSYLKANNINAIDNEAIGNENYPYAVISTTRLNANDCISNWTLEINVWDKNHYYSRSETIADDIEKLLDFKTMKVGDNFVCMFKAGKMNIPDTDKAIKRVRTQFDLKIYESEM